MTNRELFYNYIGQTSPAPFDLEIERAEGIYMYNTQGKKIVDLISGVSVSNVGHCHPKVVEAVKKQAETYMHLMVYGEFIETPQVQFAKLLTSQLPTKLNNVYFVNSGSEANEGALKLAKRCTGRGEIVAFKNAYHGSSHGALSVLGNEYFKQAFRPLLPNIRFLEFNVIPDLAQITNKTACVIVEPIQGEAGVILPENDFLKQLRKRCDETGALLIFDEVQTGFGRTGKLFAFEHYGIVPDILTIAKGMGGGMPIGAFVANKSLMDNFMTNPVLGHITTFGGHPVSCAAALASLTILLEEKLIEKVEEKSNLFKKLLTHEKICSIHGKGLFLAVELESAEMVQRCIRKGFETGFVSDWFIFNDTHFRIAPPLTITMEEIEYTCNLLKKTFDSI